MDAQSRIWLLESLEKLEVVHSRSGKVFLYCDVMSHWTKLQKLVQS